MTLDQYERHYHEADEQYKSLLHQSNQLSFLRFILFIISILCLLIGYFYHMYFLYLISLGCLSGFIIIVYKHNHMKTKIYYFQSLTHTYHTHIQRIHNQWDAFEDDGTDLLEDDLSIDLDLFGHHSLFQFINCTFTDKGRQLLSSFIIHPQTSLKEIKIRQEALQELQEHEDFIIQLQTYGHLTKNKDEKMIEQFLKNDDFQSYHAIPSIIFICPFIVILSLCFVFLSIAMPYSYVICEITIVFQIILTLCFIIAHQRLFEPVQHFHMSLKHYYCIFELIENQSFHTPLLQELQMKLTKNKATQAILQLSKISQLISYRQNIICMILFNAIGLYDFYLRYIYIKWLHKYYDHISTWFDTLAQIEMLISLYIVKMDDFDVTLPHLTENMDLSFDDLKHPLLDPSKAVGNSFQIEKHVCVITGSNMSGKTTFMRTIALNLVLAYLGTYVFAKSMNCAYMTILTSMRVKDNVEEGISTFYGELLRIKKMIAYSQKKEPMICFIDEIFKGTNSLDRIAGAKATIQKLSLNHCFVFITTHDFELCQCENCDISNYHFTEYYQDNHIYFDYLIHKGQSQTTNGHFLLKQIGII